MANKTVTIVYNTSVYVYKFRVNLIKKIQSLGFDVVVISPFDEWVDNLLDLGVKHHHISMSQYGMNPFREIMTTVEIYKALRKYKPEYSLHYTIKPNVFGNIAAAFLRIKVINNIAGAGKAFSSHNKIFKQFIFYLYRFALSKSAKVFFQNNEDMAFFINNKIVNKEISERIPGSGVDLKQYDFVEMPRQSKTSFLFVGRLLCEKGIVEFLEAAKRMLKNNDVRFDIVGEHENNENYIPKSTLEEFLSYENINYHGLISPKEMPEMLVNTSCVVLPSYYREGVPRSLLEAASIGRPIITTDNVGCRDVVDDGVNGYQCLIKDAEGLFHAMDKFVKLPYEEKRLMGQAGRKKVETEFDEKIVLDAYVGAISSMV